MTALRLPDQAGLPEYMAALQRGWSPSSTRNICAQQLAAIEADASAFLGRQADPSGGTITDAAGTTAPALPGTTRWIWDHGFCGSINLRYQPGTTDLPSTVSGHVGYSIVPWRQRQGHGTAALRLMLPLAAAVGLPYIIVTCNTDNAGSRKIIAACGGVFLHEADDTLVPGTRKLVYRLVLS